MSNISLADLTPADLQALLAQFTAAQAEEKRAAKLRRARARAFMVPHLTDMLREFGTRVMGDNGVIGQTIGGTITLTDPETGLPREARASMSLRWADTLPARVKGETSDDTTDDESDDDDN